MYMYLLGEGVNYREVGSKGYWKCFSFNGEYKTFLKLQSYIGFSRIRICLTNPRLRGK